MLIVGVAPRALADPPVTCDPGTLFCFVQVDDPGAPGSGGSDPSGGGAPSQRCYWPDGREIPCSDPTFGWWSNADQCYYKLASPQPPKSDPVWKGNKKGAVYDAMCPGAGGAGGGRLWIADPPPGFGATGPSPARLADEAVSRLPLRPAVIGMAPTPGNMGVVGAPVWLWTQVTPQTWGPIQATASVPGLSVTAVGRATHLVWDMGDGGSVRCTSPGSPYLAAYGYRSSPDCGYTYRRSSAGLPGDAYAVTVTTTWRITWSGGGTSGVLTQTRATSLRVQIGELQVLIT
jgi:hypothetical protein